jgi:hypothetical protein
MDKQQYHKPEFHTYGKINTITAARGSREVRDNPGAPADKNKSVDIG